MNGSERGRRRYGRQALATLVVAFAANPASGAEGGALRSPLAVEGFYAARMGAPAWTGLGQQSRLEALRAAVAASSTHGLDPRDYHVAALGTADAATVERLATDAWLTLAAHLLAGKVDPVSLEPAWNASARRRDLPGLLAGAVARGAVGEELEALAPHQAEYRVLRESLARYRALAEAGGWPQVTPGGMLKPGMTGPRVAQLRARLHATGDLDDAPPSDRFDPALEVAVKRFQQRANLEPDGIVGGATLAQLNTTAAARVAQLEANLERWRWLPDDLGGRQVRVNIADFRLQAIAPGKPVMHFDVIVGRDYRETPVFSERIRYLVLNPWWETPPSIARRDKLPLFRKDPAALARQGFVLLDRDGRTVDPDGIDWTRVAGGAFPYRLRQRPGPENALGQVKIMFPNPHNVYLHDTPSRELFAHARRSFSSGCIRVREPLRLAAWLLDGNGDWSLERLEAAVASGREDMRVALREPVAVHLLYMTVAVDEDASVRFIDDIYRRDERVISALARPH